jgi:hypothetical protein
MKFLVYISTAYKLLNQDELLDILTISRKNNQQRNLTGILLYGEGTFIQVLEGEEEILKETYKDIEADERHKNVIKMTEGELEERNFKNWSMGFKAINAAELSQFQGYTNPQSRGFLQDDNSNSIINMIKTFANANRM